MMDAMAMISAEPVDMMAIRIKKMMTYSPVDPSSFWATSGAAKPIQSHISHKFFSFTASSHTVLLFIPATDASARIFSCYHLQRPEFKLELVELHSDPGPFRGLGTN